MCGSAADDPTVHDEFYERTMAALANPGVGHLIAVLQPGEVGPVCSLCGGREAPIIDGKHLEPERWCDAPQHGPAVASWPGYTPQAQAYELATRGPALDDGLPHEYGEPCECEGCQWPDYDAKVDA